MFMLMRYEDEMQPYLLDGKVIISEYYDDLTELVSWFGINDMESPVKEIKSIEVPYMDFSEAWDYLEALKAKYEKE